MTPEQENAIYAWAAAATGITTIWAREGGPRPEFPYATLDIRSEQSVGNGESRYSEPDVNGKVAVTICGNCKASVQLAVWNKARGYDDTSPPPTPSRQYLSPARSALRFPSLLAALAVQDIAVNSIGATAEFDADDGDRYLSAAVMDVTFNYVYNATDPDTSLDTIGQVQLTGVNARPDNVTVIIPDDEQLPGT